MHFGKYHRRLAYVIVTEATGTVVETGADATGAVVETGGVDVMIGRELEDEETFWGHNLLN